MKLGVNEGVWCARDTPNTLITITSSKYMISYPINMKVSNQVFNTSNSNVLGSLVPGRVIMKLVFSVPVGWSRARTHTYTYTCTNYRADYHLYTCN